MMNARRLGPWWTTRVILIVLLLLSGHRVWADEVSDVAIEKIAGLLRFDQKCRNLNESALKAIRRANPAMLDEDFVLLETKLRAFDYRPAFVKRWRIAFSANEWSVIDAYVSGVGAKEIAAIDALLTDAAQQGKGQDFITERYKVFYATLSGAEQQAVREFRRGELGERFGNLLFRIDIDSLEIARGAMEDKLAEVNSRRKELFEAERHTMAAAAREAAKNGRSDVVFDVRDLDVRPWGGVHEAPEPPADLPPRKQRVLVLLSCVITKTGTTMDVAVVRSDDARYNEACLAAVRGWTFEPGKKDGQPVACRVHVPLAFGPQ